jgi:hypothetical protein
VGDKGSEGTMLSSTTGPLSIPFPLSAHCSCLCLLSSYASFIFHPTYCSSEKLSLISQTRPKPHSSLSDHVHMCLCGYLVNSHLLHWTVDSMRAETWSGFVDHSASSSTTYMSSVITH